VHTCIEEGLVLHDFALTQLEYLHNFSNLCDNFWFKAIWHRYMAALIFFKSLANIDVTITPSITQMDYVCDISTQLM